MQSHRLVLWVVELGTGANSDFGNFGRAVWAFGKKKWFLDNVDTWLYFNSDDSDNPEDYVVEDFKEYKIKQP